MNKIPKKIFSLAAATCLLITLVIALVPKTALAAPNSATQQSEAAYRATTAWEIVRYCFDQDKVINKNDYTKVAWALPNNDALPGKVWNDSGKVDCNNPTEMRPVFQALGYDGVTAFNDVLAPRTGAGSDCDLQKNECKIRSDWQSIVAKKAGITLRGAQAGDSDHRDIREAEMPAIGRYYYWKSVYENSKWGCGGSFTDDATKYAEASNELARNAENGGGEGARYYKMSNTGTLEANQYAIFKVKEGKNIENMGYNYDNPDEAFPPMTCTEIVDHFKNKDLAEAMVAAFGVLKQECEASGTTCNDSTLAGTTDAGNTPDGATCESQNTTALSWILCPFLGLIDNAVTNMTGAVDSMLTIDDSVYTQPELKAVWSYFRVLATFLLIVIGLVMVISQAISVGPFDAYTVKKVFPRLVIGVIGVQLSWALFTALVRMTNSIGWGIQDLMYAPFGGSANFDFKTIMSGIGGGAGGIFMAAILGVGGALGALGLLGVLSFALTAFLGILIGFILLGFRQLVLVALLLVAPVAIIAWILPNTEKLWKIWWESFSKLLMLYPLIILLVAAGRIFAWSAASTGGSFDESSVGELTKFLAVVFGFFGPFFLIPKTFQLAGSAFANIAGMTNNRSKGVFDRLKNYRGQKAATNYQNAKVGQRFKGANAVSAGLNRANRGIVAGAKFGSKRAAYMDSMSMGAAEDLMKDKNFTGIMYDDDAMRAMTYGSKAEAERALYDRNYKKALADGKSDSEAKAIAKQSSDAAVSKASLVGFGGTRAVAAAQRMAMNKTGFDDSVDAMSTISRVAGGNASLGASLRENIKFTNKGVGRNDMGALRDMNDEERAMEQSGDIEGARKLWGARMALDGADTADSATLGRNHKKSMENIAGAAAMLSGTAAPDTGPKPRLSLSEQQRINAEKDKANASRVAADLSKSKDWATRGNTGAIDSLGDIPTGQMRTETVQKVYEDPNDEGVLIVRPTTRTTSEPQIAKDLSRDANPEDPRAPKPDDH